MISFHFILLQTYKSVLIFQFLLTKKMQLKILTGCAIIG